MQFFPTVDEDVQYFRSEGYTGSINDMHYAALGDLGYSGALTDRLRAYLLDEFGSYYEAMRDLRNGTSVFSLLSYKVLDLNPALVLDFDDTYYRTGGTATDLVSAATHARAGNATMFDSDGVLKWAPHNLLLQSEFAAVWSALNTTLTPNAGVSPSGTLTAASLTGSVGTATKYTSQFSASTLYKKTFSVWAKADSHSFIQLLDTTDAQAYANFDVSSGALGTTGTKTAATITAFDGGWFLCEAVFDIITAGQLRVYLVESTSASFGGTTSTTGTVLLWGAHLYRSDLGGMVNNPARGDSYVPTTDAAVYLPRVGHHIYNGSAWVDEGYFHESEARTNLITDSEDFTAYTATNATITLDGSASPANTVSNTLTKSASFGNIRVASSIPSGTYTASVFAKAGTLGEVSIGFIGSVSQLERIAIDLDSGTSPASQGSSTYKITDFSNGWKRVSITSTLVDPSSILYIYTGVYSSSTAGSVLISGAQFEEASTPSSYIPTSGSTVTRAADTLTVPSANLPWPEPVVIGPELVTNGTFDTDTDWAESNVDVILDTTDGTAVITNNEPGGIYQNIGTLTPGNVYKIEVNWIQKEGAGRFKLGDDIGGAEFQLTGAGDYTGENAITWVCNFPLEADGFITLGNPGGGGGTINIYDNISVSEINPLAVSIQMEGRVTYADNNSPANHTFIAWPDTVSGNYIWLFGDSDRGTGGVTFRARADNIITSRESNGSAYSPGVFVPYNISARVGSTFLNGATDGTALTALTTPVSIPDINGTDMAIGSNFMGTIKLFRVWADDLTDAGIEEATLPSLEPSLSLTFDGSETSFTVLDWSA